MKAIRLVLTYARNYKLPLVITTISMILLVGVQLAVPWIIRALINGVSAQPPAPGALQTITQLTLLALAIFVARAFLQFLRSYQAHIAGWGVVADLRKYVYEQLQRFSLRFYEDKQTGQLMSRVVNDTDLFEQLISHAVPEIFVSVITLVGVLIVLFSLNWRLTLLSMIPIPLIFVAMQVYARYVRPAFRQRQVELGDLNAMLNDNLSGIREIKAFTREPQEMARIGRSIDRYRQSLLHALRLMATFQPFVEFTSSLGVLIVIFFGGLLALRGALPVADLVAFFLYLDLLYQPIRNLSNSWEQVQGSLAGADRIADLLEEKPEVRSSPSAAVFGSRVKGGIVFSDVHFAYNTNVSVLDNINLEIPAQSVVALVGPTGVGKSTLVSLIPRFYDVSVGQITLDGIDLRDIQLDSLRRQISFVLQDVFLFHGTVRENILFGRQDASEAEIVNAARIANAHAFIQELPEGYDTLIGERGVKLSGGQKQRLSIARAVLKDAPILILDEATSSVDVETELLIQQALERLIVGRTTIIIAHRLSTIRNADKIVVLEGKQIAEAGTHEQLMWNNGLYRRLYAVQYQLEVQPLRPVN